MEFLIWLRYACVGGPQKHHHEGYDRGVSPFSQPRIVFFISVKTGLEHMSSLGQRNNLFHGRALREAKEQTYVG